MKKGRLRKFSSLALCIALMLTLLPVTARAVDVNSDGYDDYEFSTLQAFLETAVDGVKNGTRISGDLYNPADPWTWQVIWRDFGSGKQAYVLNWNDKSLQGTLNVSNFTNLAVVYVNNSSLTDINVTGCANLRNLTCSGNSLTSLSLSTNATLQWLDCNNNDLTSLDTSAAGNNLLYLYCSGNRINSLSITGNTNLHDLFCDGNNLAGLNVAGYAALIQLVCNNNALTSLDITGCIALSALGCGGNLLSTIDVSTNTDIATLSCPNNQLTALDLTGLTQLQSIDCSANRLTSLEFMGSSVLKSVETKGNPLTRFAANMYGADVRLTAQGSGYVEMSSSDTDHKFEITAVPVSPEVFYNWTSGSTEVSAIATYGLTQANAYDLTANFLGLTASPADGRILTNGSITITPSIAGGTWGFDSTYLSHTGNNFTPLKAGTTRVMYTLGTASVYFDITVSQAGDTSPSYISRTLTDGATGVTVAGSSIHKMARLTVSPLALHPDDPACNAIRKAHTGGQLILGYNISLTPAATAPLTISMPVGSEYNGRTVTILHCINGRLENIDAVVTNGMATFTVTELSPFAVTTGLLVPDSEVINPPKTGDAATPWGFVLIGLAAVCMGYLAMKRRRAS